MTTTSEKLNEMYPSAHVARVLAAGRELPKASERKIVAALGEAAVPADDCSYYNRPYSLTVGELMEATGLSEKTVKAVAKGLPCELVRGSRSDRWRRSTAVRLATVEEREEHLAQVAARATAKRLNAEVGMNAEGYENRLTARDGQLTARVFLVGVTEDEARRLYAVVNDIMDARDVREGENDE